MSVSLNRATIPWIANNEIPDCSRIVGFKMGHAFQNKGFCYEKVSTGGYSITVHPPCARARPQSSKTYFTIRPDYITVAELSFCGTKGYYYLDPPFVPSLCHGYRLTFGLRGGSMA